MNVITLENVSYKYPIGHKEVLQNINLSIEKGKFYALIGSNDAGKTTLCNLLRGFIPHFYHGELAGEVLVFGKRLEEWSLSDLSQKIGYVFQNPFTQISGSKETVFEEIAFGLENLGMPENIIREKVNAIIDLLEIDFLRDKNPNFLSGGQKQRISLASIIVMEPEILIIDEPTSQLDPQGTEDVFKIIKMMKDLGSTIILVEHKIELVAEYADEIILLQDGEIKMMGPKQAILSKEQVIEYGGVIPQFAILGLELKKAGIPLKEIPLTEDAAVKQLQALLGEVQSF
ncbi:energy-coupling factor ABC transporter ATP-binding protein [Listeria ivanovii]|uniref:Putative ABC transporter (ATP-binding protein) n=1 Tax=Listeria ivanovii (strain ATCC BAA-678 / PAM 55) TaxID=881621 RepID=G2Z9U3_LISIP|nr:ABC transporter ATP-binding protein [Listeria ivanovii]AHI54581.1 ABC transporter ATP-binding protein [Listeria ivanovii WSLC3009]AIS64058.1 ABC transporter ATP-binding protein [Listeria ivanovii subsp. ivanovii]MBC1759674.1 ABC transporter ATP-binding protein [Listeria ivanovii]MBK3914809.1 ABC transporter ATP-binding protein [Listeria ivanovii subsp. ivanovii]MBK3922031.1 ABC transporter ATP-binding protein [Listeria ivanovii subsp. ivanovii]